jgi:hypothetical protein
VKTRPRAARLVRDVALALLVPLVAGCRMDIEEFAERLTTRPSAWIVWTQRVLS